MMTLTCIKHHLSRILSSIHEKVKQHRLNWKKKKNVYKKSVYLAKNHVF